MLTDEQVNKELSAAIHLTLLYMRCLRDPAAESVTIGYVALEDVITVLEAVEAIINAESDPPF